MHSEGKTILWSLKQTCTIKKLPLFLWLALFLAISLSPTLSLLFSQRMIDNITAAIRDPSVKLQIGNIIIWGLFLTLSAGLSNLCALVFSTYLSNTYSIYMQERLMEQFNRIPLRQFANADFMNKTAGAVAGADRLSYFVDKSVALMTTLINIVFRMPCLSEPISELQALRWSSVYLYAACLSGMSMTHTTQTTKTGKNRGWSSITSRSRGTEAPLPKYG